MAAVESHSEGHIPKYTAALREQTIISPARGAIRVHMAFRAAHARGHGVLRRPSSRGRGVALFRSAAGDAVPAYIDDLGVHPVRIRPVRSGRASVCDFRNGRVNSAVEAAAEEAK